MWGWVFKAFDVLKGPTLFEFAWRMLARSSPLRQTEVDAASVVLGPNSVRYGDVRVAEGRLLRVLFRLNKGRAFTTFHTINLPETGGHSRSHIDIVVHELIHVCQFEKVGSIYIWQALRAQRRDGYEYGGWSKLAEDRAKGLRLRDYNREQQAQIAQDYYAEVVAKNRVSNDPLRQAYEPFIEDLKRGDI